MKKETVGILSIDVDSFAGIITPLQRNICPGPVRLQKLEYGISCSVPRLCVFNLTCGWKAIGR